MIPQSGSARHLQAYRPILRFQKKAFAVLLKRHPCMPFAELAMLAPHKARRVTHAENLSPGPQREVYTVARLPGLKFVGWLPVIPLPRHVAAATSGKKPAHFCEVLAL